MQPDSEGFIYPRVDENACINCGICVDNCPQLVKPAIKNMLTEPLVFAAKIKDRDTLLKSSSGGVFSALAHSIIEQGGVVFGVAFDSDLVARHIYAESIEEVAPMRGSKYVQSDVDDTYQKVKTFLESGRTVLYSGCPCQVAGLRSFLQQDYANLLTVDLICHGVPSPKLFKKYLKWLESKHNCKITSYEFRNKEKAKWGNYGLKIGKANKSPVFLLPGMDPYMCGFENSTFRPVCYHCHYTSAQRMGDITIADYWGVEKYHPEFYDKDGVSLILINTNVGQKHLDYIAQQLMLLPSCFGYAADQNIHLRQPNKQPAIRNLIYAQIDSLDFAELAKQYLLPSTGQMAFVWLKSVIPKPIKNQIKRLLTVFRH
jgi:coenzyme F420-reducing hydrogenase beta subunit